MLRENIPHYCEFHQFPDTPPCPARATHQVESVTGTAESMGMVKIMYYYCTHHAVEETRYGICIAFSLNTDRVEGIYTFPEDNL